MTIEEAAREICLTFYDSRIMQHEGVKELCLSKSVPIFKAGAEYQKQQTPWSDEDLKDFHEFCRDNPQKTHQELIEEFKKI